MMKHTDLQIGDYVYHKDKIVKVDILTPNDLNLAVASEDGTDGALYKDIKPIPITPEILEKNGFYDYTVCHCKTNYSIELRGEEESLEMWLEYCFTTKSIQLYRTIHFTNQYGEPDEYSKLPLILEDICYVHELQHALRLCKIDKEIKL